MSDVILNNNAAFIAALKALLAGIQLPSTLPAGLTQIAAAGQVSTVPQLVTEFQGYEVAYQAAEDAAAALHKAVQAREALAPTATTRYEAVRASLKAILGKKSPDLPVVGITPDKTPAPLTVTQKQDRVLKANATRVARGTKGPKQKAAIHGEVPAATTPATSPPVVAPKTSS